MPSELRTLPPQPLALPTLLQLEELPALAGLELQLMRGPSQLSLAGVMFTVMHPLQCHPHDTGMGRQDE